MKAEQAERQELQRRVVLGIDVREQAPDFTPVSSERVVFVKDFDLKLPSKYISTASAMMSLTKAPKFIDIGKHGPSNAANATEVNKDDPNFGLYNVHFLRDADIVDQFMRGPVFFQRNEFAALTRATIVEATKYIGIRDNLRSPGLKDLQELGKAPHEVRDGDDPIALQLTQVKEWGWPYYGADDTTVKNVNSIVYYTLRLGNVTFLQETYKGLDGKEHTYEDALQAQVNWIRKRQDLNQEGLVESLWMNPKHHANQTWADSASAFHHADGSMAEHHPDKNWGVASVYLQAEVYDALCNTADLYRALLKQTPDQARRQYCEEEVHDLDIRAEKMRRAVMDTFWVVGKKDHPGFFGRGTDRDAEGNLRVLAIKTSDMGMLLNSRILDGDDPETVAKRTQVIQTLFSEVMLAANGIRTLATDDIYYHPDRYHDGTVWGWQQVYIAMGLERHGYFGLAYELKRRAWKLYEQTRLLPEYGNGKSDLELADSQDPRDRLITRKIIVHNPSIIADPTHPVCQPGQEIQAWTAAAIMRIKFEEGHRRLHKSTHPESIVPTTAIDDEKRAFEDKLLAALPSAV
jgi:glycogen debranching enzyme